MAPGISYRIHSAGSSLPSSITNRHICFRIQTLPKSGLGASFKRYYECKHSISICVKINIIRANMHIFDHAAFRSFDSMLEDTETKYKMQLLCDFFWVISMYSNSLGHVIFNFWLTGDFGSSFHWYTLCTISFAYSLHRFCYGIYLPYTH